MYSLYSVEKSISIRDDPIYTDPDEMIYDDVEVGEEGGCNSSLDNGWSSSEFESYDEHSDAEGSPENGVPHAFMRRKPPQSKTHVCIRITLFFLLQRTTTLMAVCCTSVRGWRRQWTKQGFHFGFSFVFSASYIIVYIQIVITESVQ